MTAEMKLMTQTQYAQHRRALGLRGQTQQAVSQAIRVGRLRQSVVKVTRRGREVAWIRNAALADAEWAKNTRTNVSVSPGRDGDHDELREAKLRWQNLRCEKAQLDVDAARDAARLRKGLLIQVDEARGDVQSLLVAVRSALLAVPSRARQALPHLSMDDVAVIDELLREALEDLSDAIEGS